LLESLQFAFAGVAKLQILAHAQVGNDVRHQNLAWFRLRAKPSGQLDGRPEQVLMLFDRLAGANANSDDNRIFRAALIVGP
jgi:hypothetical protein